MKGKQNDTPPTVTPTQYQTSLSHPPPKPYEDPELQPQLHHSPQPRPPSGVQIVRTPQDAIDGSAADTVEGSGLPPVGDEVVYEVIDDFSRGSSMKRAESYDSFDSVGLESVGVSVGGNGSAVGVGANGSANGVVGGGMVCLEDNTMYDRSSRLTNNDVIYYDALQGDLGPGVQMQVENDAYDHIRGDSRKNPGKMQPNYSKQESPENPLPSVETQRSPDIRKGPNTSAKPQGTSKSPIGQKPKPPPPKPGRTPPGSGPSPGGVADDDQVYENSALEEEDTYYNAGPTTRGEERYSKLDPATSMDPGGRKANAYAILNRNNSTSCWWVEDVPK